MSGPPPSPFIPRVYVTYAHHLEFLENRRLERGVGYLSWSCASEDAPSINATLDVTVAFANDPNPGLARYVLRGEVVKLRERLRLTQPTVVLRVEGRENLEILEFLNEYASGRFRDLARVDSPRFPVHVSVQVETGGAVVKGVLEDLSRRGARVWAEGPVPPELSEIKIRLGLWQWEPVACRVAWLAEAEGGTRFGVEFSSLTPKVKRWLGTTLDGAERSPRKFTFR